MVSVLGYTTDYYTFMIILTYVLLGIYSGARFFSERSKGDVWLFKGGYWQSVTTWKYIYIIPIVLIPIYVFVYTLDVRIGFVLASNGVICSLIVVELMKCWRKYW